MPMDIDLQNRKKNIILKLLLHQFSTPKFCFEVGI